MIAELKHSPLCSRDGGRELYFTVKKGVSKFRVTVPADLLDDECGNSADEAARKSWAKAHIPTMLQIVQGPPKGDPTKAPFNQILVEEIS